MPLLKNFLPQFTPCIFCCIVLSFTLNGCLSLSNILPSSESEDSASAANIIKQKQATVIANKINCDLGYAEDCSSLSISYMTGVGVPQDFTAARTTAQKACELNNIAGCAILGSLYLNGQGGEQDFTKAKSLLSKACELNNPVGCTFLGSMYFKGQGVTKNLSKARKFLQKGCNLENGTACGILGFMYYIEGNDVTQNYTTAKELYKKRM